MTISGASTKKAGRPIAAATLAIRNEILGLVDEYQVMTVRQVFYALVTRGTVPKEETRGYRRVQRQLVEMRRKEMLPWEFIADNTRWMRKATSYTGVDDALQNTVRTYRRDLWRSQNVRLEVWLEKDALASLVSDVTVAWDVPLMVSRGTSSVTFLYEAAKAAETAWHDEHRATIVIAMYDYDAGGARACRSVERGLREYAPDVPIEFRRVAVTAEQITEWDLPTRPAKRSDPEAAKFGPVAVELDAIPPDLLLGLVEAEIVNRIDPAAWEREQLYEQSEREILEQMVAA